ncbi:MULTISPECIES: MlaD family protein [Nocardia]|uniref:MCE family protein n=1 Tax=Nocardia implantans TaxID=3108168 RepID=A0ABU6AVK7_9NOCA|nr:MULTISPECIES: MCE family protein [unclassified Nocardia]MBF6192399.1 MCE family protein [Nocardia beijingensis]MEA3527698.1 MCE family protein [Nocardia sp. CDC192]MEB3511406.1 MCE family protein [Nocardia sp. CDC186]
MSILFEKDGRGPSALALFVRGLVLVVLTVAVVSALLLKSTGRFDDKVEVTALLEQLGDGLPARSDVKFRGMLVGRVAEVAPSTGPNRVRLLLDPAAAQRIPRTVTARVVPSNVFAVSSIQLVDNGPGPALPPHAEIRQDHSLSTVQLQTALTKLREIIAGTARIGASNTVGVLAAVATATDRRGADLVTAGARLERITKEFDALLTPDGGPPTLTLLADAVRELNASAPDLLDALHHAVTPMRTFAERNQQLVSLLSAGETTLSTVGDALDRRTDQIVTVADQMGPVLHIFGEGAPAFAPIVVRIKKLSDLWFTEFWNEDSPRGRGKFQFRFTPHTPYTRADCPRYGELAGPSCSTAPASVPIEELPPAMDPRTYPPPPALPADLQELIRRVLTGEANGAESILAPLLGDGPFPTGGAR